MLYDNVTLNRLPRSRRHECPLVPQNSFDSSAWETDFSLYFVVHILKSSFSSRLVAITTRFLIRVRGWSGPFDVAPYIKRVLFSSGAFDVGITQCCEQKAFIAVLWQFIFTTAVENVPNNVCFPIFCAQELDTHLENLQIYTFPTKKRCKKLIEPFSRKLALKF